MPVSVLPYMSKTPKLSLLLPCHILHIVPFYLSINKNIHEAVIVVNSHLLILTLLYLCLIIRLRLAGMNIFIQVFIKLKFKEVEGICIMEKMRKLNELTE